MTHPPLYWFDGQSPVGGITEQSTHWLGVVSVPGHILDTYLPAPQSSGVRQGLHAARNASNVVLPEHVALNVLYFPAGHVVWHREHTRFAVVMHGWVMKLPTAQAVLHGLHTRFTVGVQAPLS